jgi:ketosteroid isomerase-like protein
MSQENIKLAQATDDAWNTGDLEALRELYDPGIVVRPNEDWPERGPFLGVDAVMRWYEQLRSTWDAVTIETIGRTAVGDRVISRQITHGAGRGPASKIEYTTVVTVRKGKIVSLEFFWDHAEALETLGLSEQDAHS